MKTDHQVATSSEDYQVSTSSEVSGAPKINLLRFARLVRFGLVGASGLIVNTVALFVAVQWLGLHYLVGIIVATQASTIWNFLLTDMWVFDSRERNFRTSARFAQFWVLNNSFLLIRGPIVWFFTDIVGSNYILSNLFSLVIILLFRYTIAEKFIWQNKPATLQHDGVIDGPASLALQPPSVASSGLLEQEDREEEPGEAQHTLGLRQRILGFFLVAAPALFFRLMFLDSLGLNSDEAVYAGQAASITGDVVLTEYFPIFRAHPLLFQTTLSIVYQFGVSPIAGRLVSVVFGLATVWVCYLLGKLLYGRRAGVIAALILAVMPYHVIVTRQVLLDGPMVFFATSALYLLAKFVNTQRVMFLYAGAAAMGLTALTNERSVVMLGGIYLFFALVPTVKASFWRLALCMAIFVVVVTPYPLSTFFSGKSTTGEQFLAWQLFRRANHGPLFYPSVVPVAIGLATLLAGAIGLIVLRRQNSWREVLLGCWCAVPLVFFEIWPVKGFQYLLALAPPAAILAGRALAAIPDDGIMTAFRLAGVRNVPWREPKSLLRQVTILVVVISLAFSSWNRITPAQAGESFLAGSGGVPGGREAGEWVGENIPEGANLMAIGPSMANIIQWYGDRKTFGLSVSPNPLHRNPVYEPVVNPDLLLRNGDLNYLVWDSFSAGRSEFFSTRLLTFVERYHGRIIHEEFVEVVTENGERIQQPVIIIFEVRP